MSSATSLVAQVLIQPVDDGEIFNNQPYYPNSAAKYGYVGVDGSRIQGALIFPSFDSSVYTTIYLALKVYAVPLHGSSLYISGFDDASDGVFSASDYGRGTLLGTLYFPSPSLVTWDDTLLYDVTTFVQSTTADYFGILLSAPNGGGGTFSSLEFNYGQPSGLLAIPEPTSIVFLIYGCIALSICRSLRNKTKC
jgi:hypothetical protein